MAIITLICVCMLVTTQVALSKVAELSHQRRSNETRIPQIEYQVRFLPNVLASIFFKPHDVVDLVDSYKLLTKMKWSVGGPTPWRRNGTKKRMGPTWCVRRLWFFVITSRPHFCDSAYADLLPDFS